MQTHLLDGKNRIRARALLVGEHLDLRSLETTDRLAGFPLTVAAGERGVAVLFRYGAVVLFNLTPVEEVGFLSHLKPLLKEAFDEPEIEENDLQIDAEGSERVQGGVIRLREFSIEHLQIVADVLAKSAVLSRYEDSISGVFERIEPFAATLRGEKRGRQHDAELLSHIGEILLIQHRMVGLVEVTEKPETLWEQPQLERLYARLEDEYELRERHGALERKLDLIERTAETVLNLLQHKSSLRVEWYIVVLIVLEMMLTLYEMFFKR